MNKNRIIRIAKLLGTIAIIIAVITIINVVIKNSKTNLETTDLKSNMLQIQAKCRVLNDKADMNNKIEEERKGNRLSSFKTEEEKAAEAKKNEEKQENAENAENTENTEGEQKVENATTEENKEEPKEEKKDDPERIKTLDEIIEDFKKLNVIPASDYDKYYALEDADLEFLGLNFRNEKNARYLINYDTREVGITCGYQGQYLLSQMGLKD